jgi:hypothetical protein
MLLRKVVGKYFPSSYLAVKHIVLINLVHVLLVFLFTLEKSGLVFVGALPKSQSEIFMELCRLLHSKTRGSESTRKASSHSNEHHLERCHGRFFFRVLNNVLRIHKEVECVCRWRFSLVLRTVPQLPSVQQKTHHVRELAWKIDIGNVDS